MLRAVSPLGEQRWYPELMTVIRHVAGYHERNVVAGDWFVTTWDALPGLYLAALRDIIGRRMTDEVHFLADGPTAELWLMLNLPLQATLEEVSRDQYPANCFR